MTFAFATRQINRKSSGISLDFPLLHFYFVVDNSPDNGMSDLATDVVILQGCAISLIEG